MKYLSGSAFRRALEEKIVQLHRNTGSPITRIRKLIAFNRFLIRLTIVEPNGWVLKGGYLMELRFHQKARTTKDIDLLFLEHKANIHEILLKACKVKLNDWFTFQAGSPIIEARAINKTFRFPIVSFLDSRTFEEFHMDVNTNDLLIDGPEKINADSYLPFSEFTAFQIPCYTNVQQIAEKLHALAKSYGGNESSRVKDFVDILLIAANTQLFFDELRNAIIQTFEHRKVQSLPSKAPVLPSLYTRNYAKLAAESALEYKKLSDGNLAFEQFIDPVLKGDLGMIWSPTKWIWE